MKELIKVLAGSKAHNLADEKSDTDFRTVFQVSTSEILSIGLDTKYANWQEGAIDSTGLEIGEFLRQSIHCLPNVLEVYHLPLVGIYFPIAEEIRGLFKYVWESKTLANAYINYGFNNLKKFLENKDNKKYKYALLMARVMIQSKYLLLENEYFIDMKQLPASYIDLLEIKSGAKDDGTIVNMYFSLRKEILELADKRKQESDYKVLNDFLLRIRKEYWE